jgi:hypothetical protein
MSAESIAHDIRLLCISKLEPLIQFKRVRKAEWNRNIEGHAAIDAVLEEFGVSI